MTIRVECPNCKKGLAVKDELGGKIVMCPCGQKMKLPNVEPEIVELEEVLDDFPGPPIPGDPLQTLPNQPDVLTSDPLGDSRPSMPPRHQRRDSTGGAGGANLIFTIAAGVGLLVVVIASLLTWITVKVEVNAAVAELASAIFEPGDTDALDSATNDVFSIQVSGTGTAYRKIIASNVESVPPLSLGTGRWHLRFSCRWWPNN